MSWVVWKTSSLGQTDRLYLNPPLSLTLCGFTVVSSSVKCWLRTRQECSGERGTLCSRVSLRQVTPSPLLPISEWKADPSRDFRGLQQSVTASFRKSPTLPGALPETQRPAHNWGWERGGGHTGQGCPTAQAPPWTALPRPLEAFRRSRDASHVPARGPSFRRGPLSTRRAHGQA